MLSLPLYTSHPVRAWYKGFLRPGSVHTRQGHHAGLASLSGRVKVDQGSTPAGMPASMPMPMSPPMPMPMPGPSMLSSTAPARRERAAAAGGASGARARVEVNAAAPQRPEASSHAINISTAKERKSKTTSKVPRAVERAVADQGENQNRSDDPLLSLLRSGP